MREAFNIIPERYDSRRNTVESLYRPFDRIKIIGNVKSITDNNDGTANVCRFYHERFRFQSGFDYVFPENSFSASTTFNTNELPDISNPPFNCPLIIQQLGLVDGVFPIGNAYTIDKGFVCTTEKWVKGSDIATSNLGSYTFTIEQWDKLKVSDPNFYQYLERNKYHIIKKETENGIILEVMIYKN